MALPGLGWIKTEQRVATRRLCASRFAQDRRGSTAVEFALVGLIYFTILFFVIQGGIFYIKVTLLDVATENAARTILLNQNPNTTVTAPPTTSAAFAALVAKDSFGVLNAANLTVALQIAPPRSNAYNLYTNYNSTAASAGSYGFATITPYKFSSGATLPYAYTNPGACNATYKTESALNGVIDDSLVSVSNCTGGCLGGNYQNGNGQNGQIVIIGGIADGGTSTITNPVVSGNTLTDTTFTGGTYTCYAGQDALLQVQYTDPLLGGIFGNYFGSVVSTIAFQIEPPPT